MLRQD
ncbi:hypothetical protein BpHYR1_011861 [Brachionus plicatilis]